MLGRSLGLTVLRPESQHPVSCDLRRSYSYWLSFGSRLSRSDLLTYFIKSEGPELLFKLIVKDWTLYTSINTIEYSNKMKIQWVSLITRDWLLQAHLGWRVFYLVQGRRGTGMVVLRAGLEVGWKDGHKIQNGKGHHCDLVEGRQVSQVETLYSWEGLRVEEAWVVRAVLPRCARGSNAENLATGHHFCAGQCPIHTANAVKK